MTADRIELILTIVVSIFGSGGLWIAIQKILDKKDTRTRMLLGLAHDRLVFLCLRYIERKEITNEEFENLHIYLYEPYQKLGGNGTVTHLFEQVMKLPIIPSNPAYDRIT